VYSSAALPPARVVPKRAQTRNSIAGHFVPFFVFFAAVLKARIVAEIFLA